MGQLEERDDRLFKRATFVPYLLPDRKERRRRRRRPVSALIGRVVARRFRLLIRFSFYSRHLFHPSPPLRPLLDRLIKRRYRSPASAADTIIIALINGYSLINR